MMTPQLVIGVDPGPTPGIVALCYSATGQLVGNRMVVQCDAYSAEFFVQTILDAYPEDWQRTLAVEQFVVGNRSGRSNDPAASSITRDLVGSLTRRTDGVRVVRYRAVDVKPWATEARLAKAGLVKPTEGMRHARDAARHALYAAVHEQITADPLSKRQPGLRGDELLPCIRCNTLKRVDSECACQAFADAR